VAGLSQLRILDLHGNDNLNGSLPAWLGECPLEELNLAGTGITGEFPAEMAQLTTLRMMDFSSMNLGISFPQWLSGLSSLTHFIAQSAGFVGSLPEGWVMSQMVVFNVGDNALEGPIPASLTNMADLEELVLGQNLLSGSLPDSLATWTALKILHVGDNDLVAGALPTSISLLTRLETLVIEDTNIGGTLPPTIGDLTGLRTFRAARTLLEGTLPKEVGMCQMLEVFDISGTRFTGTLPPELGQLTMVITLGLDQTQFSGTLPDELFNIPLLDPLGLQPSMFVWSDARGLTGTLPNAIANWNHLGTLQISGSQIGGTIPVVLAGGSFSSLLLYDNRLTGTLSEAIINGLGFGLVELDLSSNSLTGTLPSFSGLLSLQRLRLHNNNFNGTVNLPSLNCQIPSTATGGEYVCPFTELMLSNNKGLTGNLDLGPLGYVDTLLASNCNFTSISFDRLVGFPVPYNGQIIDLSYNSLTKMPDLPEEFPNKVTHLHLQGNRISSFPKGGLVPVELFSGESSPAIGALQEGATYNFPDLQVIDLSDNPLNEHVQTVVNALLTSPLLDNIKLTNCMLYGTLYTLRQWTLENEGTSFATYSVRQPWTALSSLDLSGNQITGVTARPQYTPKLATARLDNNALSTIERQWLGEFEVPNTTTGERISPLTSLDLTANPDMRISVREPDKGCADLESSSSLAANPTSYKQLFGDEYECGIPCNPFGVFLLMDEGTPDAGHLCRCRTGHGLPPEQCFDEYWRDAQERDCTDPDICSTQEGSQVCCKCGGTGGGPSGSNCIKCPEDAYRFSEGNDIYRTRSDCTRCPERSTTNGTEGQDNVCGCECEIGSYLADDTYPEDTDGIGDKCVLTPPELRTLNRSYTGSEYCKKCDLLRTTTLPGRLYKSDCVCNTLPGGILNLIEQDGECGCPTDYSFDRVGFACVRCADEGEDCNWNGGFALDKSVLVPPLVPGYWADTGPLAGTAAADFSRHSIYKCFSDKACQDIYGTCARNRVGKACSLCRPGFAGGRDGACYECQGSAILGLIMCLGVVPFIVIFVHCMIEGESNTRAFTQLMRSFRVSLKQLVKHMQVMTVVGGFTIGWPIEVDEIFDFISVFSFRIVDIAGIACLGDEQTVSLELLTRYFIPAAVVLIGILITPFVSIVASKVTLMLFPNERLQKIGRLMKMDVNGATRATYWAMILFFTTLLQNGLILFTCYKHPNGEMTVAEFPHLHCLGARSGPDDEWLGLFAPGLIYTGLTLGLGLGCYYYVYVKLWHQMEASDFMDRGSFAFLFEDFRDSCVHWPLLLLGRDAFLNSMGALLTNYGAVQLLITAFGSIVIAYWCVTQRPYLDTSNTVLELLNALSVFAICIFTAGMGFAKEPGVQDVAALVKGNPAGEQAVFTRERILLSFQLIALIGPFVIIAYQILVLIPCVERNLPARIRPLKEEEEQNLRLFLREALDITNGLHINAKNLHHILDKLDPQELLMVGHFIDGVPAATGILRDKGETMKMAAPTLVARSNDISRLQRIRDLKSKSQTFEESLFEDTASKSFNKGSSDMSLMKETTTGNFDGNDPELLKSGSSSKGLGTGSRSNVSRRKEKRTKSNLLDPDLLSLRTKVKEQVVKIAELQAKEQDLLEENVRLKQQLHVESPTNSPGPSPGRENPRQSIGQELLDPDETSNTDATSPTSKLMLADASIVNV